MPYEVLVPPISTACPSSSVFTLAPDVVPFLTSVIRFHREQLSFLQLHHAGAQGPGQAFTMSEISSPEVQSPLSPESVRMEDGSNVSQTWIGGLQKVDTLSVTLIQEMLAFTQYLVDFEMEVAGESGGEVKETFQSCSGEGSGTAINTDRDSGVDECGDEYETTEVAAESKGGADECGRNDSMGCFLSVQVIRAHPWLHPPLFKVCRK